jgi:hypothetical protein
VDVLFNLSGEEEAQPVRAAFNNVAAARSRLLSKVVETQDRFLNCQASAFQMEPFTEDLGDSLENSEKRGVAERN